MVGKNIFYDKKFLIFFLLFQLLRQGKVGRRKEWMNERTMIRIVYINTWIKIHMIRYSIKYYVCLYVFLSNPFVFLSCRLDWIECDYHSLRFYSCSSFFSSFYLPFSRKKIRTRWQISFTFNFLCYLNNKVISEIVCMEIDIEITPERYFLKSFPPSCKEGSRKSVSSLFTFSVKMKRFIFVVRRNNFSLDETFLTVVKITMGEDMQEVTTPSTWLT